MSALHDLIWYHGKFLGIEWGVWKVVGWAGNLAFAARVVMQWHASERKRAVVIPVSFWWLSLFGSWCLLGYAVFAKKDSVFVAANAFNWIPYLRNLILHRRHAASRIACAACPRVNPPEARFCMECGAALGKQPAPG